MLLFIQGEYGQSSRNKGHSTKSDYRYGENIHRSFQPNSYGFHEKKSYSNHQKETTRFQGSSRNSSYTGPRDRQLTDYKNYPSRSGEFGYSQPETNYRNQSDDKKHSKNAPIYCDDQPVVNNQQLFDKMMDYLDQSGHKVIAFDSEGIFKKN